MDGAAHAEGFRMRLLPQLTRILPILMQLFQSRLYRGFIFGIRDPKPLRRIRNDFEFSEAAFDEVRSNDGNVKFRFGSVIIFEGVVGKQFLRNRENGRFKAPKVH